MTPVEANSVRPVKEENRREDCIGVLESRVGIKMDNRESYQLQET